MIEDLATYRRCQTRLIERWPGFRAKREQRLLQGQRFGHAAEKVAENILEDLFTHALDWLLADINYQVGYADVLLTRHGVKHLIVEVKRPGSLVWNRRAVDAALLQAAGYARKQKVGSIAASDGTTFYAADVTPGGLRDRVLISLADDEPHESLWWVSVHGIYRPRRGTGDAIPQLLPQETERVEQPVAANDLRHPKYGLPARCFAYVEDPSDPRTWHLPYRLLDGSVDRSRLPKAVGAILSNYRGAQVSTVPEDAIPDVLDRLEVAAREVGRMPDQGGTTAPVYLELAMALDQMDRLG